MADHFKNLLAGNSIWKLVFFLSLLHALSFSASGVKWDGVKVTRADSQALRAIKNELVDFKGVLRSWNDTGAGACAGWIGIKCADGEVISIQLPFKGLGGRISDRIGQLQSLRRISLHDNALVGAIPATIGFLPNLRGLYLFNNRLSGSLPPSISNCPLLQTVDVSGNQLAGVIPPNLANSTRLYRLNLSFNSFSGSIPVSLSRSSSLVFLALQHNNLTSSLPDSWSSVSNLKYLTLDHNSLSGKIPTSLTRLVSLEELDLSHNKLEGSIDEIGSMLALKKMNLEKNNLDGSIPNSIQKLVNLSVLNLSNNKFRGGIPLIFGNITSLNSLDLSENNLTGEIPSSLSNLPNLTSLGLSYNNLSGAVPSLLSKKFNSTSFAGNINLCGYGPSAPPCPSPELTPPPPPQPKPHRRRKLSTKDIILIASGALLFVLLILCFVLLCCLLCKKTKSSKGGRAPPPSTSKAAAAAEGETGGDGGGKLVHFDGPFVFTANDLLCATAEIMGKSSYGTAYKATLEDENQVAVKRLREKITKPQKEFEVEASNLGKIRHPNILALRAYYLGPKGEKLLVYDYMPNGSLASFLHARGPETTVPWPTRMNIAIGITRGLCYLHSEVNHVHGNLTATNVLLDENRDPKIADVGMSRLMTSAATANVVGTAGSMGYRAPELSKLKNASEKTDVFSLGVIVLELLTGKSPSEAKDGLDLPQWVASIVKEEWTNEVFDVELMRDASSSSAGDELLNTLKLALHCVDPSPAARPEAVEVLQKLEEIKSEADVAAADVGKSE
ncbi:probably inactive leucine-rich repeat receptor-like protein kinase IMK2 [Salvia hispanica]|uniref:probably inactive leucine-rich repeat receptor-like protein kinase IMK2 n=1 Tax=Salvia hispanica TaxID=49212 RepID=UPI0020096CBE|nr:probably inactive leucine-rich repeat receptor-like protein kinase IMK2 [Salvia hispanica]